MDGVNEGKGGEETSEVPPANGAKPNIDSESTFSTSEIRRSSLQLSNSVSSSIVSNIDNSVNSSIVNLSESSISTVGIREV